jgi:hypothetical protein
MNNLCEGDIDNTKVYSLGANYFFFVFNKKCLHK